MRIAVVGAGIVGASVGWALARRGADVLMIDASEPGAGVTSWSFSWVNASNKTATRAYFDLNVAGAAEYRQLTVDLGSDVWWHQTGHLRWCEDERASRDLLAAVELQRSWGYRAELWNVQQVRQQLEPLVSFRRDDIPVAWYPDEAWVDGRLVVETLVDDAVRRGASTSFGRAVTDIVLKGDRVSGLVLADGARHRVDAVVNAVGPAADAVAGLVGRGVPMRDEPGLVVRVGCRDVPVRRAMHGPHVEIRPDGPGRVVLHSREIDALIGSAETAELVVRLIGLGCDAVPALGTAELLDSRIAQRPIPMDGFPSVGAVADRPGYFEAVTHSGITLGPVIGRLLATEILDGTVDPLVEPYRPVRF